MQQTPTAPHESPFRAALDPSYFFQSPTHDEALARLDFLVEHRRRLCIVQGAAGSGKSLLLEVFARQQRRAGSQVALVGLLGIDERELLWSICAQLGLNPGLDEPTFSLWRRLCDRFVENRCQQIATVLLLDDADEATPEVLTLVLRLVQADSSPDARVVVALAARTGGEKHLGQRLLGLSELRIELEPWDETDTSRYLSTSLQRAGRRSPTFDPPAASRLHELCSGVPRRISQMADLALLAGAGQGLAHIDAQTIDDVYQELCVSSGRGR